MISDGKGKLFEFGTWGELLTYVNQPLHNPYTDCSMNIGENDWFGTKNYPESQSLAVSGWEDGANAARPLSDKLMSKITDKISVPVIHYDVEGIDFDMQRVHNGEPEQWYRFEEHIIDNESDNVVTIVINGTASCGIEAETITKRGAVIVALIELLEYAHKKVTVIYSMPYHSDIEFRTLIKAANQPLDLARLMFASGHPSMLRRLMFHALELNPTEHRKVGDGYSMPTDTALALRGDIYFPRMINTDRKLWNTDPEKFILEQLEAQGVKLLDN